MTATPLLYVDDDEDFLLLVPLVLGPHGFAVTTATRLAEGRDALAAKRFAIVVSDLRLPDGDGLTLLAEARAAGAVAVVVSGLPADGPSAGRWELRLEKPVDLDQLAAALRVRL